MLRTLLALATISLAACAAPPTPALPTDPALASVAWLAGSWVTDDGVTEEHWTSPRGGSMLGVGRTVEGGKTRSYEHLRIALVDGVMVYHASPSGQAPAVFKLVRHSSHELVFEDPSHDFPQRVIYERVGPDRVDARIEGTRQGKAVVFRWSMKRGAGFR